jgi:hypothetical protein
MARRQWAWSVVAIAVSTCGYVGYHAVQEDTTMARGSPLAWILVDGRLWHLEAPPECVVVHYYATTGDGPKLPGSDVTLRCAMGRSEAEAWARGWLSEQGFREEDRPSIASSIPASSTTNAPSTANVTDASMVTDTEVGKYWVAGLDGDVSLRLALLHRPR